MQATPGAQALIDFLIDATTALRKISFSLNMLIYFSDLERARAPMRSRTDNPILAQVEPEAVESRGQQTTISMIRIITDLTTDK